MSENHDHHSHASAHAPGDGEDPATFWERRYAGSERVWSGAVNSTLEIAIGDLPPGRSLDLGCGEGGDVLWLAERGWDAMGIDISPTAIDRAQARAARHGLDTAHFQVADLGDWQPAADSLDLVTASFFQSPVLLDRYGDLRRAAAGLVPGGRLVLLSHAAAPSWSDVRSGDFPTPAEDVAALDLPQEDWEIEVAETRSRTVQDPEGNPSELLDGLVIARRRQVDPV